MIDIHGSICCKIAKANADKRTMFSRWSCFLMEPSGHSLSLQASFIRIKIKYHDDLASHSFVILCRNDNQLSSGDAVVLCLKIVIRPMLKETVFIRLTANDA